MVGLNYTIESADGPLPLGTGVVVLVNGATCKVNADPVNAGRFNVEFPASGPTTVAVLVNGLQPLVYNDTIPDAGGEAATRNPMVLLPLS